MTRAWRCWIGRVLIGILLSSQLAIAAHACALAAGDALAAADAPAPMAMHDGTPCPDAMPDTMPDAAPAPQPDDPGTPLCASHCQPGQQSADHASAPAVPPALLNALYALPARAADGSGAGAPGQAPAPRAGSSPPLAILHCCRRN